jgi:hypothetical protein
MITTVMVSSPAVPDRCVFVSPDSPYDGWSWMWIMFRDGTAAALRVVVQDGRAGRDQVCVSRLRFGHLRGKVRCAQFQAAVDDCAVEQLGVRSNDGAEAEVWVVCLSPRVQAAANAIAARFDGCGRLDLWVNGTVHLAWEEDADCTPPYLPIPGTRASVRVEVVGASFLNRQVVVIASELAADVAGRIAACARACGDVVECVWSDAGGDHVVRVLVGDGCVFGQPVVTTGNDVVSSPPQTTDDAPVQAVSLQLRTSREAGFCLIPDEQGLLSAALGLELRGGQQLVVRS